MSLKKWISKFAIASSMAVGLLLSLPMANAVAQEASASHLAAAQRVISSTKATDRLDVLLPNLADTAKSDLIRNQPDKEAQLSVIVDEAAIALAARRGDLEIEIANVFAKVFTEEELNAIADFYSSPAGIKFLEDSPLVLREIDTASRVWVDGIRRDLGTDIRKRLDEAKLR